MMNLSQEQLLIDLIGAYYCACKNKRKTINQLKFEIEQEEYLIELRDELWERCYKPSKSICFNIKDPKPRQIIAANFRDRVVHHLYYNYVYPFFLQALYLR